MNLLITSVGIRTYLVKAFNEAMSSGNVYTADCGKYTPGFFTSKKSFIIPRASTSNYIPTLLNLCQKHSIATIISLNDLELLTLAKNKHLFKDEGIDIVVSNDQIIEMCMDKMLTYSKLKEKKISCPVTVNSFTKAMDLLNNKKLSFPLIVKPRFGSASNGIDIVNNKMELKRSSKRNDIVIQEMLHGDEFGVDVFTDRYGSPISIYIKRKIKMRAGETDKAISVHNEVITASILKLIRNFEFVGPCDIDVFATENTCSILEINPRFGGGYPLSHSIGANFPEKVLRMSRGEDIKSDLEEKYPENIVMMKDIGVLIKKDADFNNFKNLS